MGQRADVPRTAADTVRDAIGTEDGWAPDVFGRGLYIISRFKKL